MVCSPADPCPPTPTRKNSDQGARPLTPLESRFVHARLSRNRRALIKAILDNHEEAYFLSSRELAKRYNVDAATVVRASQDLGYERFADFAADLREHFVRQITPYTVFKAATRKRRSVADHIEGGLDRDTENLRLLRSTVQTERVVEWPRSSTARAVSWSSAWIWPRRWRGFSPMGWRRSDSRPKRLGNAGNLQHKIDGLTGQDLVIAISFGRCLRETVESVFRARDRGIPRFAITDGDSTPVAMIARTPDRAHPQPLLQGLLRRADGPHRHNRARLRAPSAQARACDAGPHRGGVPIGGALVSGASPSSNGARRKRFLPTREGARRRPSRLGPVSERSTKTAQSPRKTGK